MLQLLLDDVLIPLGPWGWVAVAVLVLTLVSSVKSLLKPRTNVGEPFLVDGNDWARSSEAISRPADTDPSGSLPDASRGETNRERATSQDTLPTAAAVEQAEQRIRQLIAAAEVEARAIIDAADAAAADTRAKAHQTAADAMRFAEEADRFRAGAEEQRNRAEKELQEAEAYLAQLQRQPHDAQQPGSAPRPEAKPAPRRRRPHPPAAKRT